jgi:hypothetical protein
MMSPIDHTYATACVAVFRHLVGMIQDNPDVRYHVGGPLTTMRELLVAAIVASGYAGDPLDVLKPPAHRAHWRSDRDRLEEADQRIAELEGKVLSLGGVP